MTLVWANMPQPEGEHGVSMTPQELLAHPAGEPVKASRSPMGARLRMGGHASKVGPLAESIRQNGYQPHLHGNLHLEDRSDGWGQYSISGHDDPSHMLHGVPSKQGGTVLVRALEEARHTGPVPVHVTRTQAPERKPIQHEPEEEEHFPGKGETFYHGTIGRPGEDDFDEIAPASQHGQGVTFHSDTSADHAYATTSEKHAWDYARKAFDWRGQEGEHVPKVYQVSATGPVEKDPDWDDRLKKHRGNNDTDRRSKHPFVVEREMDPPEDIREDHYSFIPGHH